MDRRMKEKLMIALFKIFSAYTVEPPLLPPDPTNHVEQLTNPLFSVIRLVQRGPFQYWIEAVYASDHPSSPPLFIIFWPASPLSSLVAAVGYTDIHFFSFPVLPSFLQLYCCSCTSASLAALLSNFGSSICPCHTLIEIASDANWGDFHAITVQ